MRSAWFGAAFSAFFFSGFGAHAHPFPDNGVFDKFLNASAPQCVPVKAFDPVSKLTELSPAQFEFVRAIYVTLPPISRKMPPGDHAVIAKPTASRCSPLSATDRPVLASSRRISSWRCWTRSGAAARFPLGLPPSCSDRSPSPIVSSRKFGFDVQA